MSVKYEVVERLVYDDEYPGTAIHATWPDGFHVFIPMDPAILDDPPARDAFFESERKRFEAESDTSKAND